LRRPGKAVQTPHGADCNQQRITGGFFNALTDGGEVQMPQARTFFSPRFGMVSDRFGILWMIMTDTKSA
jgi:uncharacterized glyoxalase superfamily protein PhnB